MYVVEFYLLRVGGGNMLTCEERSNTRKWLMRNFKTSKLRYALC